MSAQSDWISLGEAAKLLGVHPTTVRNWADQGDLPFRRTPGRHRRFSREVILQWAAENKTPSSIPSSQNPQLLVEAALGHTRFGVDETDFSQIGWYGKMSQTGIEQMRKAGRMLLEGLMRHLQDTTHENDELSDARRIGQHYAEILKSENLSLAEAIRGFTYFNDFLIESTVNMMAPNMSSMPSEWSDLLRQINAFTNEVLVEMTAHYESS